MKGVLFKHRRLLAAVLLLALPSIGLRAEGAYTLGEGDALRVVLPANAEMSGTYRLGAGGRIALPIGEEVRLSGMTIEEATAAVTQALSRRIKDPAAALEIVERRPYFVTGDVAEPGAYPHLPGLTVERAIAVAGGTSRVFSGDLQYDVTGIRAEEEYEGALVQLAAARLREARVEAALAGSAEFDAPPPPEGMDAAIHARLAEQERKVAQESIETHESRMALLAAQHSEIETQIRRLEDSVAQAEARVGRIDQSIESRQGLIEEGLLPAERVEAIEMRRSQAQSELLQAGVLLSQAREDRLNLELELDEAPRQRRIALLSEAAQVQIEILRLQRALRASSTIMEVTGGALPSDRPPSVSIVRDGQTVPVIDRMTDPVRAGDLLVVRRDRAGWSGE